MLLVGSSEGGGGRKDFTSLAGTSQVLLGATVASGLVIGSGILTGSMRKGDVLPDAVLNASPIFFFGSAKDALALSLLGVFADYYFDPTRGMHVQGSLSYGWLGEPLGTLGEITGVGVGLAFGNQWWISSEWSLGLLGRVQYLSLSGPARIAQLTTTEISFSAIAPALLISLTYH